MTVRHLLLATCALAVLAAVGCGWHWLRTPPCVRFLARHMADMSRYSGTLLQEQAGLAERFPLAELVRSSGVNDVEVRRESIDYAYYRYFTFPDGPMDHLVYVDPDITADQLKGLAWMRQPIWKVQRLAEHWYYVETD